MFCFSRQVKAQEMLLGTGSFSHHHCCTYTATAHLCYQKRAIVTVPSATIYHSHMHATHKKRHNYIYTFNNCPRMGLLASYKLVRHKIQHILIRTVIKCYYLNRTGLHPYSTAPPPPPPTHTQYPFLPPVQTNAPQRSKHIKCSK